MLTYAILLGMIVKTSAEEQCEDAGLLQSKTKTASGDEKLDLGSSWFFSCGSGGRGEPGTVDGLYTFGAPGSASPGFELRSADGGCFPGARVVTLRTEGEMEQTDPIAWLASRVSLWHPRMDLYLLDVDDPSKDRYYPCTLSNVQHWPNSTWLVRADWSLHSGTYFNQVAARSSNTFVKRLSNWALDLSYTRDAEKGAELARQGGFRVVGAARYQPGDSRMILDAPLWPNWWQFGEQVSYLVQHPQTLECLVTFQGTYDTVDWSQNARGITREFCGLTLPDDRCCPWPLPTCRGDCRVQRDGDSFVHSGFWAELYRMTQVPSWQQNIRPRLPYCKEVSVFGHSLGGAMSTLFAACIGRAPKNGTHGYEDYASISWTKQRPKLLPENATFEI
ncbi:unnamed protein product [Symbiodinium necroappetens]|uniref:Fungal lipase-type domain-containing protein n=1 Tax=Symbiodinium necroappetens TaxID=1628268 RepID=A0A812U105_9DINO|nr:unnamed protein product [Symbiodinium necroappetens]